LSVDAWDTKLIGRGELPSWDRCRERGGELGEVLQDFLRWQARNWSLLGTAVEGLDSIETRRFDLGGRPVVVQWNPGRQASTTAKIDGRSLKERACFLCPANQPVEERGIPFGDDLVVLPNPAPITPLHLVLASRRHVDQTLDGCLDAAIAFALATAGHLTVLYNGPRCGASAPDHLHLQAFESGSAPDERALRGGRILGRSEELTMTSHRGSSRHVLELCGTEIAVANGVRAAVRVIGEVLSAVGEPPVNLLLWGEHARVRALIYPRGAHRPECYSARGDQRCLVSPGALDMAGLVITVRRQDYEGLDDATLGRIFEQTSVVGERAAEIERRLEWRP
jgi:hypothetical protein